MCESFYRLAGSGGAHLQLYWVLSIHCPWRLQQFTFPSSEPQGPASPCHHVTMLSFCQAERSEVEPHYFFNLYFPNYSGASFMYLLALWLIHLQVACSELSNLFFHWSIFLFLVGFPMICKIFLLLLTSSYSLICFAPILISFTIYFYIIAICIHVSIEYKSIHRYSWGCINPGRVTVVIYSPQVEMA